MAQLVGLSGLKGPIDCEFFNSITEVSTILKKGIAATTANTNGAINIWIGDDGLYRGSLKKHQRTLCEIVSVEFVDVRHLCKQWLQRIK
jgi:hypothetical protein